MGQPQSHCCWHEADDETIHVVAYRTEGRAELENFLQRAHVPNRLDKLSMDEQREEYQTSCTKPVEPEDNEPEDYVANPKRITDSSEFRDGAEAMSSLAPGEITWPQPSSAFLIRRPTMKPQERGHQKAIGDTVEVAAPESDYELLHLEQTSTLYESKPEQDVVVLATVLDVPRDAALVMRKAQEDGRLQEREIAMNLETEHEKSKFSEQLLKGFEATAACVQQQEPTAHVRRQQNILKTEAMAEQQAGVTGKPTQHEQIEDAERVLNRLAAPAEYVQQQEFVSNLVMSNAGQTLHLETVREQDTTCVQETIMNIDSCFAEMEVAEQSLDGVWMRSDGQPIAVVRGLEVELIEDFGRLKTVLTPFGNGVWAIDIEEEEFLGDVTRKEDGTLLLAWSEGQTWQRQASKDSAVVDDDTWKTDPGNSDSDCTSSSSGSTTTLSSINNEIGRLLNE